MIVDKLHSFIPGKFHDSYPHTRLPAHGRAAASSSSPSNATGAARSTPPRSKPSARELRARHWALQRDAGLDFVTVGDFAYYDHVANHIQLLGCEPARFGFKPATSPSCALLHDGARRGADRAA
jgi:hypothetical protein